MKIAVYFDLPYGGAYRSMEEILLRLKKDHTVTIFKSETLVVPTFGRISRDWEAIVAQKRKQKKLAQKIDNLKFDLVFVTHDRFLQAPWILRFLKTKSVFLCQEPTRAFFEKFLDVDEKLPLPNKVYEKINRFFRKKAEVKNASFATKIIANSHYSVESIFRSYGQVSTPIYLGFDSHQFFPKKLKKLNQVMIVGNNEPQKALIFAVDAVSLVSPKNRPNLLIACPRSGLDGEFKKYAKTKKVKLIEKCGLTPEELCHDYNQSLATLATAHLEPFGLSVIESIACGTPVIAVNEGGFRETISDGKNGFLIARDAHLFAKKITEIVSLKSLFPNINSSVKDFTWDNTVKKIENIFYEVA